MICWLHQEEGFCEGTFNSNFFPSDGNNHEWMVYTTSPDFTPYAEKCVQAFHNLSESAIHEICKRLISAAADGSAGGFEMPVLSNTLDILNYCWFVSLYADKPGKDGEISYIVAGEWAWGREVGFIMRNDEVIYAGADFFNEGETAK